MDKYTSGPWRKVKRGAILFVEQDVPHNPRYIARVKHYSKDGEANARLIAEAPAMLQELEYALGILLKHPNVEEIGLFSIQDTIRRAKRE